MKSLVFYSLNCSVCGDTLNSMMFLLLSCILFRGGIAMLCYNCTAVDIRSTTKVVIDKFDSFAKRLDKECHSPKGKLTCI